MPGSPPGWCRTDEGMRDPIAGSCKSSAAAACTTVDETHLATSLPLASPKSTSRHKHKHTRYQRINWARSDGYFIINSQVHHVMEDLKGQNSSNLPWRFFRAGRPHLWLQGTPGCPSAVRQICSQRPTDLKAPSKRNQVSRDGVLYIYSRANMDQSKVLPARKTIYYTDREFN